ncbi:DUF411 domain-containing protein [Natronobiforma cellulositropha]|uniref:DUF411 domain-containing protein n=1 Tax=Natronobiforma cellulositropha TaxID=1679076 RepID=UPI0021D5B7FF|nr:DUF411 domain-containing protein [Natronobiforma cellulositropha]
MAAPSSTRRSLLAAGVGTLTAALAGCLGGSDASDFEPWNRDEPLDAQHVTQYNAPGCGCCGEYARYFENHFEGEFTETTPEDINALKREYGIPDDLYSCHTLEVDGYVVEGHVPVEAIDTLLTDEPDLVGIALPEMPSGSPGMPGDVEETFVIYGFDADGTYDVYTEL